VTDDLKNKEPKPDVETSGESVGAYSPPVTQQLGGGKARSPGALVSGGDELSSDVNTQPIDKSASQALERYREIVGVLVERPPGQLLPSEQKRSLEELGQYDLLVGKYAGLLPVLELPSNAAFGETALLGALALQAGRTRVAAPYL
jgi:hypothetical protein